MLTLFEYIYRKKKNQLRIFYSLGGQITINEQLFKITQYTSYRSNYIYNNWINFIYTQVNKRQFQDFEVLNTK